MRPTVPSERQSPSELGAFVGFSEKSGFGDSSMVEFRFARVVGTEYCEVLNRVDLTRVRGSVASSLE
jgi:hypothetical protein